MRVLEAGHAALLAGTYMIGPELQMALNNRALFVSAAAGVHAAPASPVCGRGGGGACGPGAAAGMLGWRLLGA